MCKERLKIILDCDDVLYPSNQMALQVLNEKRGTCYSLEEITNWGFLGSEIDDRLELFHDQEFVRNLPPYEGGKEFCKGIVSDCRSFYSNQHLS